jgi:diphthamide synthase (EF-2-diphthine--ammonia ligase)
LAEEMIAAGLVAYVTCVDPKKLSAELAGRAFDRDFLERLDAEVDPCAERGEFHTCVTAGPMFTRPVPVEAGETVERDGFVFADLKLKVNESPARA